MTSTSAALWQLPPPPRPLTVAVYDFPDQTGALKATTNLVYDYSKAVTQGAASVLVDTLKYMGNGAWFTVVERSRADDLLKERKLIQETYVAVKRTPEKILSPMHFAEYIFAGGITSFDSTIASGGIGAIYLGIGPQANYTKNFITVTLRLVDVRTGRVITSVTTSKSVFSVSYGLSVIKYVAVASDAREVHVAFATTEPTQIAVREAIESAVYQLVQQALPFGLWSTKPPEVLPPELMANAIRDAIKAGSKKPQSPATPATPTMPPKPGGASGADGQQTPRPQTAGVGSRLKTAATTADGTLLLFSADPIVPAGKFH